MLIQPSGLYAALGTTFSLSPFSIALSCSVSICSSGNSPIALLCNLRAETVVEILEMGRMTYPEGSASIPARNPAPLGSRVPPLETEPGRSRKRAEEPSARARACSQLRFAREAEAGSGQTGRRRTVREPLQAATRLKARVVLEVVCAPIQYTTLCSLPFQLI